MDEQLFAEQEVPRPSRRGKIAGVAILLVIVGAVVAAVALSDGLLRSVSKDILASEIAGRLPAGLTGTPQVELGGGHMLGQLVMGRFDEVALGLDDATIAGQPVDIQATLHDVPRDTTAPFGRAELSLVLPAASAVALLTEQEDGPLAHTDVELGDDSVRLHRSTTVLGMSVGYALDAKPSLENGNTLVLEPLDAQVTAGPVGINLQPLIDTLLQGGPITYCLADQLPAPLVIDTLVITAEQATITAHAADVSLAGGGWAQKGSCG